MSLVLFVVLAAVIQGSDGLTVNLAPYNTSAVIGGNVTLACLVSNKQSSENVKWYVSGNDNALTVNDVLTTSDGHYRVSGQYNLTIINVTLNDQTQYKCVAANTDYFGSLTVVDLPANLTVYWGSSPAASATANITCSSTRGHPPPALSWFKNNVALDTSNAVYTANTDQSGYGEAVSILPVRLTSSDEGAVFRCEASYTGYDNALNANLTTTFNAYSGSKTVSGCDSLCDRTNSMTQTWKERLTPSLAYWFYSNCGLQSCPDFDAIAARVSSLVRKQLCASSTRTAVCSLVLTLMPLLLECLRL